MVKVKFTFCAEPSLANAATTVTHVISIQRLDESSVYIFPPELRSLHLHEKLMLLPVARAAKKDLAPRWTRRSFKCILDDDLAKLYFDEFENPIFNGILLNERGQEDSQPHHSPTAACVTSPAPLKSLASIVKDAVVPKFGSKTYLSNAGAWLDIFESECQRLLIDENRYWEAVRLFLEESAEKWYNTTRLSSSSTAWNFWRQSFLENFGTHSLGAARSAFYFKYTSGSLSDYAQHKLYLLASYNPKMHELDRITQLALGLPRHLQDRINLAETTTLGKMLSTINSLDSIRPPQSSSTSALNPAKPALSSSQRSQYPCPYCKRKGYERYHFEKDCLTKVRDARYTNNSANPGNKSPNYSNVNKAIHSFDLEDLQQEIDAVQKNA
ncbi:Hypothetical protein NTJ_16007 [Nesidiocoris tenuis]|uniref:Retrotransposon gag domain-containing protein n=1 Tax=Nesidiocoris tenuis TaxID=355587 RepID=A0ABN7BFU5_9HEMI|nr:Hypothetical protein NTJ_16007 [Nesidiocoris tenuis]